METVSIPRSSRVRLCHALVDHLADSRGIRALHIKGYALDAELRSPGRESTDVDVLVHPDDLRAMTRLLTKHGFTVIDSFMTGSPFSHSMTFEHPLWGLLDLHRLIPGFTVPPRQAFEALWGEHEVTVVAGRPIPVPDPVAQALIVLLHAARNAEQARSSEDVRHVWDRGTAERRRAIDQLARAIGAELPLAMAVGRDVTPYARRRDFELWMAVATPGPRVREWQARFRAAPSWSERLRLASAAALPSRHALAERLSRPPTNMDVVRESARRVVAAVVELAAPLGARRGRGS